VRLINGMRTTTNQKRFQDLITGMKLKSSFEFHDPLLYGILSNSLWLLDSSTYSSNFAMLVFRESHYHLCFERRVAHYTTALRAWYNSSCKLQCTLFLKLGSHYQRVSNPTSLRSWDNSTNDSNFTSFVFIESH